MPGPLEMAGNSEITVLARELDWQTSSSFGALAVWLGQKCKSGRVSAGVFGLDKQTSKHAIEVQTSTYTFHRNSVRAPLSPSHSWPLFANHSTRTGAQTDSRSIGQSARGWLISKLPYQFGARAGRTRRAFAPKDCQSRATVRLGEAAAYYVCLERGRNGATHWQAASRPRPKQIVSKCLDGQGEQQRQAMASERASADRE